MEIKDTGKQKRTDAEAGPREKSEAEEEQYRRQMDSFFSDLND